MEKFSNFFSFVEKKEDKIKESFGVLETALELQKAVEDKIKLFLTK